MALNPSICKPDKEGLQDKYEPLPGQFIYKNILYSFWTTLETIKRVETGDIFYPDDTVIATYPKSGTTVLQELVWLICNNADIEKAKQVQLIDRVPFIEYNEAIPFMDSEEKDYAINFISKMQRPRILKTHSLYRNLELQMAKYPEMKFLTTFRNPKDNAVSFYHFYKNIPCFGPFLGTWDDFFERWYDGWVSCGDWLDVVTEWWGQRHRHNLKIIFYEDIVRNRHQVVREICEFLGKDLSEDDIDRVANHTSFKNMQANPATNYESNPLIPDNFQFMRKGEIGDWKNYFSEEQSRKADEKYEPILRQCGLKFIYE